MPRRERYLNSLAFLENEAKARSVAFIRFSSPHDAANHIAQQVIHAA